MRKVGFQVESLNPSRVVDKLVRAGIAVLGAEKTQKNAVTVWVDGKDAKKVFAILRGSCYNVTKVRARGLERLRRACLQSLGVPAGIALFLVSAFLLQGRVLKIDVAGSGAYYEAQVRNILSENGTALFSAPPREDAGVSAKILALPRVSFCSLRMRGGVLTVTVEVSDENVAPAVQPLLSPADGVIEELTVVRGTPLLGVDDAVKKGDAVVDGYAVSGETVRPVLVIARVKVRYPVSAEYALDEAGALAQAFLDYGEIENPRATQTENGWRVEGEAFAEAALNLA